MTKVALSVERPVYPAGRAVHFFGAADESLGGRRFHVGGQRATTLRFGRLVLIVRYVDAAEWAPEEVERRRTDDTWLRAQATLQEAVLERAMLRGTVVPARFLAVFPTLERLEDEARASYGRWRRALTRLAGKEEWTLAVFRGPHIVPSPLPYLLRATRVRARPGALRLPNVDRQVAAQLQAMWQAGLLYASAARQIESLPHERNVFRAAFLVPSAQLDGFRTALAASSDAGRALSLSSYVEGPRPPYTFV